MPPPVLTPPLRPRFDGYDALVVAFIVATRLVLIAHVYPDTARMYNGDSAHYVGLAQSLVSEGRYVYAPYEPYSDLIRPPGYPVFIALNLLLFGRFALLALVLWNVVGAALTYLLTKTLLARLGAASSRVVGALFALDLAWLLYSKEVVPEPVFTPLLVGALVLLVDGWRRREPGRVALSALLVGVAALVKPVALYLPAVPVAGLLAARRWKAAAVYAVVFLAAIAPWLVRNEARYGAATFTSIQGNNLLFAHAAFVYAGAYHTTHRAAQDSLGALMARRYGPDWEGLPFLALDRAKLALARDVLRAHPIHYARAVARGVLVTLFDPGRLVFNRTFPSEDPRAIGLTNTVARDGVWGALRAVAQKSPAQTAALLAYLAFLGVVNALAALGVVPFYRQGGRAWWLVGAVVGYLLVVGGPNGYARFRLYVFPFLLIYAHFGWTWIAPRLHLRWLASGKRFQ